MRLTLALVLAFSCAAAADRKWACEGGPEFVTFARSYTFVDNIPAADRREYRRNLVTKGIAEHPEDIFYHRQYRTFFTRVDQAAAPAMVEMYKKLLADHPGDSLYLYLYGESLIDRKSDEALKLLQRASELDPANPWTHLAMAEIFNWGRLVDKKKVADEVARYWELCPGSLDSTALEWTDRGTPDTMKKIAASLRPRLEAETDRNLVPAYETLWSLEFRATPPSRYDELKKTIAKDLEKLRQLPDPNRQTWVVLLKNGYKSVGDEAGMRAADDEILRRWPNSNGSLDILRKRFNDEHPWPKSDAPKADKEKSGTAHHAFAEEMLKRWPDNAGLLMERFSGVGDMPDPSPEQIRTAAQALLEHIWQKHDLSGFPPFEFRAADLYIAHGVNLEGVPALVEKGIESLKKQFADYEKGDSTTPEDIADNRKTLDRYRVDGVRILIDLYAKTKEPAKAVAAFADLRAYEPKEGFGATYYQQAARVAELTGGKLDALLYYQTALDKWGARTSGKDDIAANIDRLWKDLGGSAEARRLLGAARPAAPGAAAEATGWKKPEAPLPSFELEDLTGKLWRLKSLEGKTLLVNVWATWCGPCVAEHPAFQALYDKLKSRTDVQVLSLNIDENPAEIAPYLKKYGYTFPVLPAQPLVEAMLPQVSIPRNWIVNGKGALLWEQTGYGSDDKEWEKRMLEMLEKTIAGK